MVCVGGLFSVVLWVLVGRDLGRVFDGREEEKRRRNRGDHVSMGRLCWVFGGEDDF